MRLAIYNIFLVLLLCSATLTGAQTARESNLLLFSQDVRIEENPSVGGFFLYVKNKPGIASVLLTESSETPARDSSTYAYRSKTYNDVNGSEKRVLNKRFIRVKDGYFIVDSTPEPDIEFDSAYVLFIPYEVEFGYPNTRNGSFDLRQGGLYMSIRTFGKPFADYTSNYQDNSFYLRRISIPKVDNAGVAVPSTPSRSPPPSRYYPFISRPDSTAPVVPDIQLRARDTTLPQGVNTDYLGLNADDLRGIGVSDKYSPDTVESFTRIADRANTKPIYIDNKDDIISEMSKIILSYHRNKSIDIMIVLDTTRSMWDDMAVLKTKLIPALNSVMSGRVYRFGVVLFRDTDEVYVTKRIEFVERLDQLQNELLKIQTGGGGDWPEATYEALHEAVNNYTWISENRILFLVSDAPPHEPPRSTINQGQLFAIAKAKRIVIYPMIVPRRE